MSDPTRGWYDDPNDSTMLRWWDGSYWTAQTKPKVAPAAGVTNARINWTSPRLLAFVISGGVVLLIAAATGILPGLLVFLGLTGLGIAIYVFIVGSASRLRLRSRAAGAAVLGVGFALILVGGVANAVVQQPVDRSSDLAHRSSPERTHTPSPTPTPTVTVSEVQEVTSIPYQQTTVEDPNLDIGTTAITTPGVSGEKVTTYRITSRDGVEISRVVAEEVVTVQPVTEVTSQGTRQPAPPPPAPDAGGCHASYAGVCVPIASDVDCAGGSGNGPEYVRGPLQVVGTDVYDLDRDGDGIACD
ncbi:hypothetical protein GCM10027416_28760 [Okibacterium endophyticum]